jgi:hypothetical protein
MNGLALNTEISMASSKSSASHTQPQSRSHTGQADNGEAVHIRSIHARGHRTAQQDLPTEPASGMEWLQGAATRMQRAMDSMLQLHQQWIQGATQSSETLAEDLKGLQQARDPAELLQAHAALAGQQLELLSSQYSSMLQQIYDAHLLWLGQWDDKQHSTGWQPSDALRNNPLLSAWGKAQDDWLQLTRSWIDSVNQGGTEH